MKKIFFVLVLLTAGAFAQQFTPNLQLQLPPRGATNWDTVINGNFSNIDAVVGILQAPFQGGWNSGKVYSKAQEVVGSNGSLYLSLINLNLGNDPTVTPTAWQIILVTAVPHTVLGPVHSDTVAATIQRGDGFFAVGATPLWQRVAHSSTTGGYFKWNGTDVVASALAAAGTGTCTTSQFVTALNGDAAPTCTSPSLTGPAFGGVGSTTTVLHGNAGGALSFGFVNLLTDVINTLQVSNGGTGSSAALAVPLVMATFDRTGQVANVTSSNLITSVPTGGIYEVQCYTIVTTVGTTSTLPQVNIGWTDVDNGVTQSVASTTNAGNTTTTMGSGNCGFTSACLIDAKLSTAITVSTTGYASTGTAMQYALHCKLKSTF